MIAETPLKILVIGGTEFVGRHIVEAALARGHELTLFNRGKTNPGLFQSATEIHGDRDGELEKLGLGPWDAAVDTCGYVPRVVESSAIYLSDKVERYLFISSVSAYADLSRPNLDEDAPLGRLDDPAVEEIDEKTYGPLKALCETSVRDVYPTSHAIVRPGLVAGPHDPTDRFTHWPHRIDRGGDVLTPPLDSPVQYIDARDVGEFVVLALENGIDGTFNAVTEPGTMTMGMLVEACRTIAGSDARFVEADAPFLLEAGVEPWTEIPVWMPSDDPTYGNLMTVSPARAVAAGLTYRSLQETVRDTLGWDRARGEVERRAGLGPEKENEVLAKLENGT